MQIDRIEVERQMPQQRRACQHHEDRAGDDRDAMPLQELIQRSQPLESDRGRFTWRIEHHQHRGHQRDAAGESNQHPATRNQPELGKAAITGWQEREKSDRGGGRSQRQRFAGFLCRASQCDRQLAEFVPFAAISHAELNAEIDAEAHEQHEERDRNQIEGADHGKPKRGGRGKPDHQAKEHRNDDPHRAERQPKNDQDPQQRRQRVAQRAVADHRKLVIVHRHLAGETDRGTELLLELQIR